MPPVALQARPATGLIDASIAILRRRYWDFFLAELVPASPFLLLTVFASSASIRYINAARLLALPVASGISAWLVSQEFTGRSISLGDAVRRTLPRSLGLIGISLVAGISVLLGVLGAVVGAFVVLAWMYCVVPVYALEDINASEVIERSMALARGNVLHVLGVCLAALFAFQIVDRSVALVIRWAWHDLTRHVYVPVRVETLLLIFLSLALLPLGHVPQSVVYFDLRVRREGMDIEAMAALNDPAAPNAPEASPA